MRAIDRRRSAGPALLHAEPVGARGRAGATPGALTGSPAARWLAFVAVGAALAGLLLFGVAGVARGDLPRFDDVRYFSVAGALAAAGSSPYDHAAYQAAALRLGVGPIDIYAYPPHSLPPSMLIAALPIEAVRWAWGALNIAILLVTAWAMALRYLHHTGRRAQASPAALWIAALVIGNPFSAHLVWTAQTGLMVTACLLLAWHADRRGHWLVAGVLLGLATVKPHLSLLVLAWFAFTGRWRAAAVAAATVAVLLAWPLATFGPALVPQWIASTAGYEQQYVGALSYNSNLKSLLMGLGVEPPPGMTPAMLALALAGVGALAAWHRRHPLDEHEVQAVLLAGALFLVQGRDYDMAVLAPLVPMLFWHARERPGWAVAAAFGLLLLCVPHRHLAQTGWPVLPYYRIALLGAFWAAALALALRPRAPPLLRPVTQ